MSAARAAQGFLRIFLLSLCAMASCRPQPTGGRAPAPPKSACASLEVSAPLRDPVALGVSGDVDHPRLSPDGTSLVYRESLDASNSRIMLLPVNGGAPVALTEGRAHDRDPTFSHDGKHVVFSSNRDGDFDLYTVDALGGAPLRLTDLPGDELHPDWSPRAFDVLISEPSPVEGAERTLTKLTRYHQVLFERCLAGEGCRIESITSDGVFQRQVTASKHGSCHAPRWDHDTLEIAFDCDLPKQPGRAAHWHEHAGQPHAGRLPGTRDGGRPESPSWPAWSKLFELKEHHLAQEIARFEGFRRPAISPNSLWALAEREDQGQHEVWLLHRDGKQRQRLMRGSKDSYAPSWSADGRSVVFVATGANSRELCVARSDMPLSDVANLKDFDMLYDLDGGDLLAKNDFALLARGETLPYPDQASEAAGAPSYRRGGRLISSDVVLRRMHDLFDKTVIELEEGVLRRRLERFLLRLRRASGAAYERDGRASHYRLAVLSGVAARLLVEAPRPTQGGTLSAGGRRQEIERHIAASLGTVNKGGQRSFPKLTKSLVDLTELQPRGHYDKPGLRGYFRALMWLSQVALYDSADALDAYLLLERGGNYRAYQELQSLYQNLVGEPEFGHLELFARIEKEQPQLFRPLVKREAILGRAKQLVSRRPLGAASDLAKRADGARHDGGAAQADGAVQTDGAVREVAFHLFPSRWAPDVAVMERLTDLGASALDVMAALGSAEAARYSPTRTSAGYAGKLAEVRNAQPALFSPDNAYRAQLWALEALVSPVASDMHGIMPRFVRSQAYRDKLLHTALLGYTALKHNTVAMTRRPRVRSGSTGIDPVLEERLDLPRPPLYVEPTQRLFARLMVFCDVMAKALGASGKEAEVFAQRFAWARDELLRPLRDAVVAQRGGIPLSNAQYDALSTVEEWMRSGMRVGGWQHPGSTHVHVGWSCLVADLWAGGGVVRALAIGEEVVYAAVVPYHGQRVVVMGSVTGYYEFDLATHERPTDDAWCAQVREGTLPPRPAWTGSFMQTR